MMGPLPLRGKRRDMMSTRAHRRSNSKRTVLVRALSVFLAVLIVGGTFASLLQLF